MAILNIHLNTSQENKNLVSDFFKLTVILVIFHLLMSATYGSRNLVNFGLTGGLLNSDFVNIFIYLVLAFSFYHLIISKLIAFN